MARSERSRRPVKEALTIRRKSVGENRSEKIGVRVRFLIDVNGKSVALSPGMMASVEIKTGTRRIIEFVLSPLMRMGSEAGSER